MQKITLLFLMMISMTIFSQEKLEYSISSYNDIQDSKTEYTYDGLKLHAVSFVNGIISSF